MATGKKFVSSSIMLIVVTTPSYTSLITTLDTCLIFRQKFLSSICLITLLKFHLVAHKSDPLQVKQLCITPFILCIRAKNQPYAYVLFL